LFGDDEPDLGHDLEQVTTEELAGRREAGVDVDCVAKRGLAPMNDDQLQWMTEWFYRGFWTILYFKTSDKIII